MIFDLLIRFDSVWDYLGIEQYFGLNNENREQLVCEK